MTPKKVSNNNNNNSTNSISIEETNKIRISLGLKPIPLPIDNLTSIISTNSISLEETNKISLGLKPIPEQSTEQSNETLQRKLELSRIKRENKRRLINIKTILDQEEEEEEEGDWLNKIGKIKPDSLEGKKKSDHFKIKINKIKNNLRIGHDLNLLKDQGNKMILTFKEGSIYEKESELVSENLLSDQGMHERLNKEKKKGSDGTSIIRNDGLIETELQEEEEEEEEEVNNKRKIIQLDSDDEVTTVSDYAKPIKMKKINKKLTKPRKKETKKMSQVNLLDYDQDEDEIHQNILLSRKKYHHKTPEQLAKEIQEEKEEEEKEKIRMKKQNGDKAFVVIDEGVEFLSMMTGVKDKKDIVNTVEKIEKKVSSTIPQQLEQEQETTTPDFSTTGLSSTLQFLQSRNVLSHSNATKQAEANAQHRKEMKLSKIKQDIETRILRERLESQAHVQQMAPDIKEAYITRQLEYSQDRTSQQTVTAATYNPQINIQYHDSSGRQLTTKEAYKELSHKFHGNTDNTKFNDEKRRKLERRRERQDQDFVKQGKLLG